MHPDQLDIDADIVAALVADQFPQWRGQAVRRVESGGTVNAQFRLGDRVVLRFPLVKTSAEELATEAGHARRIGPAVPLAVPEPLGLGRPGPGYPGPWAAYRWIDGEVATPDTFGEPEARELAGFVRALRAIGTGGREWPGRGRGGPLDGQDAWVRHSLSLSRDLIDTARLTTLWDDVRSGPEYGGPAVWLHADLMPGNLLMRDGRLAAVIDLGAVTVGDPAVDLLPAWCLMTPGPRRAYREALAADDATWARGRGWALVQAIGALPYYQQSNPGMARTAARTLNSILSDEESR
jgi:aminoglycoside phosphotransferase (APT) family kinase protein